MTSYLSSFKQCSGENDFSFPHVTQPIYKNYTLQQTKQLTRLAQDTNIEDFDVEVFKSCLHDTNTMTDLLVLLLFHATTTD